MQTRLFNITLLAFLLSHYQLNASENLKYIIHPIFMHNASINANGDLIVTPSQNSNASDFDFLLGQHIVHHKKLQKRLINCTLWDEFPGFHSMETLLKGNGNLEQHFIQDPTKGTMHGIALRLFNPKTRLWTIHWSDSKNNSLDVPVVGSFENKIGYFYAKDNFEGKPILIQFKWDKTNETHPVWSQAFSDDSGKTWEWNWYMYFSKKDSFSILKDTVKEDSIGVIELRNYVMKKGMRDRFIDYFQKNFVISQEQLKAAILGQYRVKGSEDNFCWVRGFQNMEARSKFLPEFYMGAFWKAHRNDANNMLANNDNVYLLRPMELIIDSLVGVSKISSKKIAARNGITVVEFFTANTKLPKLQKLFAQYYLPLLEKNNFHDYSIWTSELRENDFPQLPVFQDKNLLVLISFYPSELEYSEAIHLVESQLDPNTKAEFDDTITFKNTWILYPAKK